MTPTASRKSPTRRAASSPTPATLFCLPGRFTPRMEGCATTGAGGRITGATTKLNATAASVTLASSVAYQPMSNLVQNVTYGNGLNDFNTFTLDHELDVLGTYNSGASVINRAHTRTDLLNLTNIFDNVTTANTVSAPSTASIAAVRDGSYCRVG